MPSVTRPSLAFSVLDGVLLIAHGQDAPDDATWDRLVAASMDLYRKTHFGRSIATSEGGAPTAAQRHRFDMQVRQAISQEAGVQGRIAILTRSTFVRAVMQASTFLEQNWFVRKVRQGEGSRMYRAFAPTELSQALAWLDVPRAREGAIEKELERLRAEVG